MPPSAYRRPLSLSPEQPIFDRFMDDEESTIRGVTSQPRIPPPPLPLLSSSLGSSQTANMSRSIDLLRESSPVPPLTSGLSTASTTPDTPHSLITPVAHSTNSTARPIIITPSPIHHRSSHAAESSLSPPSSLIRVKSFPHTADLLGNMSEATSSRGGSRDVTPATAGHEVHEEEEEEEEDERMESGQSEAVEIVVPRQRSLTGSDQAARISTRPVINLPRRRGGMDQEDIESAHADVSNRLQSIRDRLAVMRNRVNEERAGSVLDGDDSLASSTATIRPPPFAISPPVNHRVLEITSPWNALGPVENESLRERQSSSREAANESNGIDPAVLRAAGPSASISSPWIPWLAQDAPQDTQETPPVASSRPAPASVAIGGPSPSRNRRSLEEVYDLAELQRQGLRRRHNAINQGNMHIDNLTHRDPPRTSRIGSLQEEEAQSLEDDIGIEAVAKINALRAERLRARARDQIPFSNIRISRDQSSVNQRRDPSGERFEPDQDHMMGWQRRRLEFNTGPNRLSTPARPATLLRPSTSSTTSEATVPPPRPSPANSFGWTASHSVEPLPVEPPTSHNANIEALRRVFRDTSPPGPYPQPSAHPANGTNGMERSTSVGTAFRDRNLRERLARLDALRTQNRRIGTSNDATRGSITVDSTSDNSEDIEMGNSPWATSSIDSGDPFGYHYPTPLLHSSRQSRNIPAPMDFNLPRQTRSSAVAGGGVDAGMSRTIRPHDIHRTNPGEERVEGAPESIRSWNQTVQDAVNRRLPYDRPRDPLPTTPRQFQSNAQARLQQFYQHEHLRPQAPIQRRDRQPWGEIPIDTFAEPTAGVAFERTLARERAGRERALEAERALLVQARANSVWAERQIPVQRGFGTHQNSFVNSLGIAPPVTFTTDATEEAYQGDVSRALRGRRSPVFPTPVDDGPGENSMFNPYRQPGSTPSTTWQRTHPLLRDMGYPGASRPDFLPHHDIRHMGTDTLWAGHEDILDGNFDASTDWDLPDYLPGGGRYHRIYRRPNPIQPYFQPSCPFSNRQTLVLTDDMTPEERKTVLGMVVKGVGRLPAPTRKKAAETMLEIMSFAKLEASEGMEKDTYCSVCHDEYTEEINVAVTPCKHMYHQECLGSWLHRPNVSSCPMCRRDLAALTCITRMLPSKSKTEAIPLWMSVAV